MNLKKTTSKISILFLSLLILNSCLGVKTTSTRSGKNFFETFYVGSDGTQYYIKPLKFKNKDSKETLLLDMTFRYKDEIRDSATLNFSINSQNLYKSMDSIVISNGEVEITTDKIDLLFNEKIKKGFLSRLTAKIPLADLKLLYNQSNWTFTVISQNQKNKFESTNKAQKVIGILKNKIFILM